MRIVIASGGAVGLAKGIIEYSHTHFLVIFSSPLALLNTYLIGADAVFEMSFLSIFRPTFSSP